MLLKGLLGPEDGEGEEGQQGEQQQEQEEQEEQKQEEQEQQDGRGRRARARARMVSHPAQDTLNVGSRSFARQQSSSSRFTVSVWLFSTFST